jgi:hypothetical protein
MDQTLARVDDLVIELMNEQPLAGLAVGIVQNGDLVYSKGFGFADIEKQRPITADTVFRIGSISKTFTAIGLMQLCQCIAQRRRGRAWCRSAWRNTRYDARTAVATRPAPTRDGISVLD